eukprot:5721506-Pyramimonas_sp.AAC.1
MVVTRSDLESLSASACRIQSSELGLLPELGPRNYSYCSRHHERYCRLSALNSGCRGLQCWWSQDKARSTVESELVLLPEL